MDLIQKVSMLFRSFFTTGALEVHREQNHVHLRYRRTLLVWFLAMFVLQEVLILGPGRAPIEMGVMWAVFVAVLIALNWFMGFRKPIIDFDLAQDSVRSGWRKPGRVSDLQSIRHRRGFLARLGIVPSLQLVFARNGRAKRWTVPQMHPMQAARIGRELADALNVPFE